MGSLLGPLKWVVFAIYRKQAADLIGELDELIEASLREHEDRAKGKDGSETEEKDLMDLILEAYNDEKAPVKITRDHIKAFVIDMFVAGTSTTADTIQWGMAELINRPDVFKRVREEIESVIGKEKRLVEDSDIQHLPFLQAVSKETLRLHPPGPVIPRRTLQDCKVGKYHIPQGTNVLVNAYPMMRDPTFFDRPDEFIPERFMDSSKEKDAVKYFDPNMSFLPFGFGRRLCPGSALGLTSVHTTIAALVQCFDWEIVHGDEHQAKLNMEVRTQAITSMAHPIQCIPKVYFDPFSP